VKLTAAVTVLVVASVVPAAAETTTAAADVGAPYVSKKDRERAAKTTTAPKREELAKPGAKPAKLVNLWNQWTKDWLAVDPAQLPTVGQVDRFLRDHFTNEVTTMDHKLIGVVVAAAKEFRADTVTVVSGFRHPKYNLMLRKKGHQVARDSQHTHGTAVDFTIARVSVHKLHAWAKAQKLGGVGIYLSSGFIHMDTGPIRFWSGE
jgi:uncharacterized protein YcbK (DUF882 family)